MIDDEDAIPKAFKVKETIVTIRKDEIRKRLVEQVTGTVRWRESVAYMASQGVTHFIEIGSGKVLSGLARRIDRQLSGLSIGAPADIEAFVPTV